MLTDIFADRYDNRLIWSQFTAKESKLLMQCFRLIAEDVMPYWVDGKVSDHSKQKWESVHDRLSRELGLKELSPKYYSYQTTHLGKAHTMSGAWNLDQVCQTFVTGPYESSVPADRFIKERLSFVELAFRLREEEINRLNVDQPARIARAELEQAFASHRTHIPGSKADAVRAWDAKI